MRAGWLLLAAGSLALVGLGGSAATAEAVTIITVSQNTSGQTQTQTGRISRDGLTSSCAAPTAAPSVIEDELEFRYVNHTFRSSLTNPVCVEVDITSACADIFSVAYAGTFDPTNPRTRYAADMGDSAGSPTYSFTVPGGSFFSVVVHETAAPAPCGAYTVTFRSRGPWATSPPAIGGSPSVGTVLTGTNAAWAMPTPTVQSSWLGCDSAGANCTPIPGATGPTYTVTDADLGGTLRFRNDATDTDGTNTSESAFVEPFIPFEARAAESLVPGDRVQSGIFARTTVESRCGVPTAAPTILQPALSFLYDVFAVRSLLNESVCLVARTDPACGSGVSPAIYNPTFAPASLAANYAGNSGVPFANAAAVSSVLPAAGAREVTVSHGSALGSCGSYGITLGAAAPFASARPAIGGNPIEGGTLTASDGAWSGTPAISRAWLRCDAAGSACVPIPGAGGASYTPTAADAGLRLRVRMTATQGRSVSSDSEASAIVAAAPRDRRAPRGSVRLVSRNLKRAVGSGRVPLGVTVDESCTVAVELRLGRKVAKRLKLKRLVIARVRARVPTGRPIVLRAKLTSRARRALRKRRSVAFSITATLTDPAGNRSRLTRKGALKRPAKRPRRS